MKRAEAPLHKADLLDVRSSTPAFDYAAMCFDDVKLVQMVRFKSRSKLLNGHIVVNGSMFCYGQKGAVGRSAGSGRGLG